MFAFLKRRALIAGLLATVAIAGAAYATSLKPMNLKELCERADRIFRGTIVSVRDTTVSFGEAEIPALSYTVRVEEAFKGEFDEIKGVQLAEFKMIGNMKQYQSRRPLFPGFPILEEGGTYLLMVAPEGPVGLTSTMGLGQGCFNIVSKPGDEAALNLLDNVGLFKGMSVAGVPAKGPVSYDTISGLISGIMEGDHQ